METPPQATEIEKPAAPEMVNASAFGSTGRSKEEQMSADVYKKFMDFYTNFDPTNIYKNTQTQFDESMQRAGDAFYNEFSRRSEPEFARQRADLERTLIERGLDPSSEQYDYQMKRLAQQQNDARQTAQNQAAQQSLAYQQQLFGQGKDMALMPMSLASQVQAPALAQGEFARTLTEIGARGTEERKGIQLRGTEERKTVGAQLEADLKKLDVNQANEIELAIKKGEISLAEARERIAADVQIASSNNVAELEQIAADARNKPELLAQQQVFDAEQARVKAKEDERLLRIENRSQEKIARITRPRGGAGELSEQQKAQKEFDEAQNRALLLEWQAKMKQKGLPSGEDIFWNTFRTKGEQEILRQMEG